MKREVMNNNPISCLAVTIIWIILSRNWDEAEFVIGNCLAFVSISLTGGMKIMVTARQEIGLLITTY